MPPTSTESPKFTQADGWWKLQHDASAQSSLEENSKLNAKTVPWHQHVLFFHTANWSY